jgi:hypothetical protein
MHAFVRPVRLIRVADVASYDIEGVAWRPG